VLYNDITKTIGNTPIVKLNRVSAKLKCNLYAKLEYFNPGGSVKDRIAIRMIEDAEKEGRIKPGDTLIEPTSGNTGIGLALAGAVKGYHVIITMPEKMSKEKQVVLEALGAKIIRTPTEAAFDAPDSHISVAEKLQKELPNAHILDQYTNPSNPNAHIEGTAQEIWDDLNGKVDMVVIGAGTGGTITGVAKRLKELNPDCIVVGADPVGSILANESDEVGSYKVEGIGYDFIPDVLDRNLIDRWVKTKDTESFTLARRLIKEEGILCGGSAGSALYAAYSEATSLSEDQNCVVLFADGVRNYMTKFVDDKWMIDNKFSITETLSGHLRDVLKEGGRKIETVNSSDSATKAMNVMKESGYSQLPVLEDGKVVGLVNEDTLLSYLLGGQILDSTPVAMIMDRNTLACANIDTPLSAVQELLNNTGCVVVVNKDNSPLDLITKIDLVDWISTKR
jgi:cystathionine beta-synthase